MLHDSAFFNFHFSCLQQLYPQIRHKVTLFSKSGYTTLALFL
jgi:hypothetical protein